MHYYLTNFIGTGTDTNPFRARGLDQPGAQMIDLRPNGANQAGRALLAMPVRNDPGQGARYLGEDVLSAIPLAIRTALANDLGITLDSLTLRQIVVELLSQHARTDGTRWRPLRPNRDGMWRVYLGGLLWEAQSISGGASVSDNFDVTNNAVLSGQLTWDEFHNAGWQTLGNQAAMAGNVGVAGARVETDLDTDDHWSQATLTAFTRGGGTLQAGPIVRKSGGTTAVTYYSLLAHKTASLDEYQLNKYVTSAVTILGVISTAPTVGTVIKVQADGSTITPSLYGSGFTPVTDTDIAGDLRVGIRGQSGNAGSSLALDDFSAADVTAGPTVVTGAATLSGTGALAAAASVRVLAAATLIGAGAASATASVQVLAAAALSGTGALSAAALVQVFGAATLTGSGALAASGMTAVQGVATLSGAGSLAASAQVDVLAAATLTGNGALAAVGDVVVEGVVTGVATLSGTGALTATARVTVHGAGVLTGLGALTATGQAQVQGAAALSGLGSLTALARLRVLGAAVLSGVGSLTASGGVSVIVDIFTGNADWTLAYDNADSLAPSAIPSEAPEVLVPTAGVPAGTADWTL